MLRVHDFDVVAGADHPGSDFARSLGGEGDALWSLAAHPQSERLDIQHDIGNVFTHSRDRGELVQDAVDTHRRNRRSLQRRQKHASERVAQRQSESPFQRLGDDGRHPPGIDARHDVEFRRFDKSLPVLLNHKPTFHRTGHQRRSRG